MEMCGVWSFLFFGIMAAAKVGCKGSCTRSKSGLTKEKLPQQNPQHVQNSSPCFVNVLQADLFLVSVPVFRFMHFCWKGRFPLEERWCKNCIHPQQICGRPHSQQSVRLSVLIRPHPPHPELPQFHSSESTAIVLKSWWKSLNRNPAW